MIETKVFALPADSIECLDGIKITRAYLAVDIVYFRKGVLGFLLDGVPFYFEPFFIGGGVNIFVVVEMKSRQQYRNHQKRQSDVVQRKAGGFHGQDFVFAGQHGYRKQGGQQDKHREEGLDYPAAKIEIVFEDAQNRNVVVDEISQFLDHIDDDDGEVAVQDLRTDSSRVENSFHVVTGNASTATLDGLVITGGNANGSTASQGGGIKDCFATLTNCTIRQNIATYSGGGIYIKTYWDLDLQISNSTISTNQTPENGAALYIEATDNFSISAALTNNTLSGNTSGIYIETGGLGIVTTSLRNNIVANSAIINCVNVMGHASNLSDDNSCLGFTQGDPMLGPLTDNGGPTLTHLLLSGSDAIGAGDTPACQNAPVNGLDQRGEVRPAAACDIGSVEVEYISNPIPLITSLSPASAQAGGSNFTLTVTGSDFVNGAQVRWNGAARTTTFVSDTQLRAQITAADIASQGSASITVLNPAPGGGLSNALAFSITPPAGGNTIYLPQVYNNH